MAKRNQKISRNSSEVKFNCPAISVVIPLYNAEKYIGECLDSLLAQTFQNFEVIVVDDCSTDSSPAIVESYAEKFGGRLTLLRMIKNSGSGTEPRNLGLAYSRGEYLFFMDNDDAITPTALEELYTHAKNFDADVVHCEKIYMVPEDIWTEVIAGKTIEATNIKLTPDVFAKVPTLLSDNLEERTKIFATKFLRWEIWTQLIRRRFVLENNFKFVGFIADDMIFTLCEFCCAKKYVVVPNVINYYRTRSDSLYHKNLDVAKKINSWVDMLKDGVRYIDGFLSSREFFSERPDLKYMLFDSLTQEFLQYLNGIYAQIPAHALDELIRKEFAGGDNLALTSYIFNKLNVQRLQLMQTQYKFNQFAQAAQRRIAELEAENRRLKENTL